MPEPPPKETAGRGTSHSATSSESGERRTVSRFPLIADAEVTELDTGARMRARISELSLKGCYIDTMNPHPIGTLILLRLVRDKGVFETPAMVIYDQPGFGMGVAFTSTPAEQKKIVEGWIAELSGST